MATPKVSATRQTLPDSWRLRLEETQACYHKATERYRRLLQEQPDGMSHDPKGALALARQAETEALAEYRRVLRAFTELTLHRKVPDEQWSTAGSDGL
jgi:hypothetical protein